MNVLKIANLSQFHKQITSITRSYAENIRSVMGKKITADVSKYAAKYSKRGVSGIAKQSNFLYTPLSIGSRSGMWFEIMPHGSIEEAFVANVLGSSTDLRKLAQTGSPLGAWVEDRYNGVNKGEILAGREKLRIRSRDSGGYPPLGSPFRNFFGKAYNDLMNDLPIYGLRRI